MLAIVDGLDEAGLRTAVAPLDELDQLLWAEGTDDDPNPLGIPRSTEVVLGFYRDQIARATQIVAARPLTTTARGGDDPPPRSRIRSSICASSCCT